MAGTTWMFRTAAAVAVIGAVAIGGYAIAEGQGRGRGPGFGPPPIEGRGPMGRGRFGGPLGGLRDLSLTEAQQTQVREIMEQRREEMKPLHEKLAAAHQALRDAVDADTIDEGAIRQRSAEVAAVEADLAVAQAHLHHAVLQLLTPEQQQKLKERRAQMQERLQNRPRIRELRDRFGAGR